MCVRALAQATTMNDTFTHPEHIMRSLCYLMSCRDAQVSVNCGGLNTRVHEVTTNCGGLNTRVHEVTTNCGGLNTRVHEVTTKYGNSPPPKYK